MHRILYYASWLCLMQLLLLAPISEAADFRPWRHKLPITFSGYTRAETLTNFPALISFSTNISGFLYSNFQTNRADLRFADSTETNELNYEVESWDTNGSSYVWVQVPRLTSNAVIYAYWGKDNTPTVPAYTTNGSTWTANFNGVWHLNETNGITSDSSTNRCTATITGTGVQGATGQVGRAYQFSGTASYVTMALTNGATVTISAWGRNTLAVPNMDMLWCRVAGAPYGDLFFNSGKISLNTGDSAGNPFCNIPSTVTQMLHYVTVIDPARTELFINGQSAGTAIYRSLAGDPFHIGSGCGYDWHGVIDEMQVASVVRSSNWIWAAYMNMASNGVFAGSFNSYSNVVAGGTPVIINSAATDITGTSATLNGTLTSTGQFASVVGVYWGTNDADMIMENWSTNVWLGPRDPGPISLPISSLSVGTIYYYRFLATNTSGESWASTSESFMTLGGPTYADNSSGASNITAGSALLQGTVTGGSPAATVYFFWNTTDGGTNKTAWTNSLMAGTASTNTVSATLSGLSGSQTYFYRCYGSNSQGEIWADTSTNFSTPAPTLTINDTQATKGPEGNNVTLSFPVTLSAPSAIPISVDFATSNGLAVAGSDYVATNGTLTIPAGSSTGQIEVTVLGGNADQWPSVDLYMNLSNVVSATFAAAQGHGTIMVTNDTAETKIWTGTGDWTSLTNWSPAGAQPSPSDTVFIKSGICTVSSPTTYVPSLTVSNGATLTFSNWMSAVRAGSFIIRNTARVTHVPCAININSGNTNRIYIICTNLTVDSGGSIDVTGMGYPGGDAASSYIGYGPGGGGGGASHGGRGYGGLPTYGSASAPSTPGSGGGTTVSSAGGGVVWIEATGTATVNGVISANGAFTSSTSAGGAGSGGSIYLACRVLAGANSGVNGVISADGKYSGDLGHPGHTAGGGRIAVIYDPASQSHAARPTVIFSATSFNNSGNYLLLGEPGTLYFTDAQLITETLRFNGQLVIPGFTQWSPANLTLTNAWVRFPDTFSLTVSGNVAVVGAYSALELRNGNLHVASNLTVQMSGVYNYPPYVPSVLTFATNSIMHIGGTLTLSNSLLRVYGPVTNINSEFNIGADCVIKNAGGLHLYAGATNGTTPYGLTLRISNDVTIAASSWIYPYSQSINGGSVYCMMRDLTTLAGGGIDAATKGFSDASQTRTTGFGPGGGNYAGGGSYGGAGGGSGGAIYGNSYAPAMPGSGSGSIGTNGLPFYPPMVSKGGGLIWLEARKITHNGTFTANGQDKSGYWQYGSSGGGIFLRCATWAGTSGVVTAKGGNGNAGTSGRGAAGGGGRIAVWRQFDEYLGTVSNQVAGGTGYDAGAHGQTGTVVYGMLSIIDNGTGATDITGTSATLTGTLIATGSLASVVGVCWGTTDGESIIANWATNVWLGAQEPGPLSCPIAGLTIGTRYYYRFLVRDAAGDTWATSSTNFVTQGGPQSADNAAGASNITDSTAILCGTVTGGSPTPMGYFFWNTIDGGTDKAAWTNVLEAGVANFDGSVSATLTGLLPDHNYYYRCYGSNENGVVWATVSTNFTTSGSRITISDAVATKPYEGSTAILSFPVTLSAISTVPVTFDFTTSNGLALAGADYIATNGTLTIPAGSTSSQINVTVIGTFADQWPSVDLFMKLSNPISATFADAVGLGTIIVPNDSPETKIWTGTGNWASRTNWSPAGALPSPSDTVIIQSGTCTLSAPTTSVPSLTVSNGATLVFSNWMSTLNAGQVTIRNGATVTHAPCAINVSPGNTNRVYIVCADLTVDAGGKIDVTGKGYPGADAVSLYGYGPGGGTGGGASHGGRGYYGPAPYGSASAPAMPGSGGFYSDTNNPGGNGGGGAVWIEATGTATINGLITANGGYGANSAGGGSGGSIYLSCRVLAGTNSGANGVISADGRCGGDYSHPGQTAGGGRIAILYDVAAQSNAPLTTVLFSASSLNATANYSLLGEPGTLYLPDTQLIPEVLRHTGQLVIPGFTQWSPATLTLSNAWIRFPEAFDLTVAGDLSIIGGTSALELRNGNLRISGDFSARPTILYPPSIITMASSSVAQIGGSLTLNNALLRLYAPATNNNSELSIGANCIVTNNGSLHLYAGATNNGQPYGLTLRVANEFNISTASWVYVYSEPTNGGSVYCTLRNLTTAPGGGFDATAKGFADGTAEHTSGFGPGGGKTSGGGGYGGTGAVVGVSGGITYGNSNAPTLPGSGAGYSTGGRTGGGGLIWIQAYKMTHNGTMVANGQNRSGYWQYGSSGGGIYLRCKFWTGTGGILSAKGGDSIGYADERCAAGGGGRIAVWREIDEYTGPVSNTVAGGTGYVAAYTYGQPGTLVWGILAPAGTLLIIQ